LLFAADRMDHLAREVLPALDRGTHVVSDRYYHSSLAYQGEESEREFVEMVNQRARPPDLTLLLRVSARQAAQRRHQAGRRTERYDDEELQQRIAHNYDRLVSRLQATEQIRVVDGSLPPSAVQDILRKEVENLCGSPSLPSS